MSKNDKIRGTVTRISTTAAIREALDSAADFARASRSGNTLRCYDSAWRGFLTWCEIHDQRPLPATPETLAAYIADRATGNGLVELSAGSLGLHLSAIAAAHRLKGHEPPTECEEVKLVMQGVRRTKGTAQEGKLPATLEIIKRWVGAASNGPKGIRDRALVLLGFAAAFRRSELVALDVEDIEETEDGLRIRLRRSKTDQEGKGRVVGVPFGSHKGLCPVRALKAWLEIRGVISTDTVEKDPRPLFVGINRHGTIADKRLSGEGVAKIIKTLALAAGLDPALYSGHSLRSGHVTEALGRGAPERVVQAQTGHRGVVQLRKYAREADLFKENSAAYLGL